MTFRENIFNLRKFRSGRRGEVAELADYGTALYLASTAKSNSVIRTLSAVHKELKESPDGVVPLHLRNAPTGYMASEGYSKGYKYPHQYPENFTVQDYLPKKLKNKIFYYPGESGIEKKIKERLNRLWGKRNKKLPDKNNDT